MKPRKNESALHHFICKVIEEDLKGCADEISLKETMEPDVIAVIKGRKVAFEVETGTGLERGIERVAEKFARVRKNYADYFIVVSDRVKRKRYRKFGKVITRQMIRGVVAQLTRSKQH